MKLQPAKGMAFIQEDKRAFQGAEKNGIVIPDQIRKGVGTTGTIVAVTNKDIDIPVLYHESLLRRCPWINDLDDEKKLALQRFCDDAERGREIRDTYVEGDRVVFSRFAEQIVINDGGTEHLLFCVPIEAIFGFIK